MSVAALAALLVGFPVRGAIGASHGSGASAHRPEAGTANKRSIDAKLAWVKAHPFAQQDPSTLDCTVSFSTNSNVNLDCDDPGYPQNAVTPNNEEQIVVDPANANHMIVSSNDYSSCCDEFYTTFDGGYSWSAGDMSHGTGATGSDPVTAIDPVHQTAVHASLNYIINDNGEACDGHVVVSVSTDGGLVWGEPIIVYHGSGCDSDPVQVFNDKEWITADTNLGSPYYGRLYLTWTRYLVNYGVTQESPIWESHSDDGGYTWSAAKEISGNASFCTYQTAGSAYQCDEDQGSVPTVGPDGTVTVAFINEQNNATWEAHDTFENEYLVVQSHNGGTSYGAPVHVVDMEDGSADYPLNVDGRQTLTGFQARVWAPGNIAADPSSGRLALVFSDNRNGNHDVTDPETNTDVFLMTSTNGTSWAGPFQVTTGLSDEWFPWVAVDPVSHKIGIVYHGRDSSDSGFYSTYFTLATGHSHFSTQRISDKISRPRQSLWFRAGPAANNCHHCATFIGDYINVAFGSDGSADITWTDMRRNVTYQGVTGYTENAFFAQLR
jgi:hypothetical protein